MKKGFTLSELLVCLAVLALVLIIAIPSIIGVVNRNKERQYELYLKEVSTSLETHITNNRNLFTTNVCNPNCVVVVQELINAGLLDSDLKNPKTSDKINSNGIIYVIMDDKGNFTFTLEE